MGANRTKQIIGNAELCPPWGGVSRIRLLGFMIFCDHEGWFSILSLHPFSSFPSVHCLAFTFRDGAAPLVPSAGPQESCLKFIAPHVPFLWNALFLFIWTSLYILPSQSF